MDVAGANCAVEEDIVPGALVSNVQVGSLSGHSVQLEGFQCGRVPVNLTHSLLRADAGHVVLVCQVHPTSVVEGLDGPGLASVVLEAAGGSWLFCKARIA